MYQCEHVDHNAERTQRQITTLRVIRPHDLRDFGFLHHALGQKDKPFAPEMAKLRFPSLTRQ
jgi:hypothetical protein